jgi:hypothetical protein
MQPADRAEVEVQLLWVELESSGNLVDRLLQLHQSEADVFDFFRREGFFFEPPDGLALQQFPNEFHEGEDELDDRALHVFGIGIPSQGRGS